MRRSVASLVGSVIAAALVQAWPVDAAASPSFPAAVDQHLMLTGSATIEQAAAPPDGCLLCHMTEAGGDGTNNAFGSEMLQNGAVQEEPSTVGPALDAIAMMNPQAIQDIVMGVNPNDDPAANTVALPQPSYGCSATPQPMPAGTGWMTALAFSATALVFRRARRAS